MLQCIGRSVVGKREDRLHVKMAQFAGLEPSIAAVAERRSRSRFCRQPPYKWEPTDEKKRWKIRVAYAVAEDGFVVIRQVSAIVGCKYSCFYDPGTERVGTVKGKGTDFHPEFVYLTKEKLDGIIEAVGRVEDSLAARRLAQLGPQVFEAASETRLKVQQEESLLTVPSWELKESSSED